MTSETIKEKGKEEFNYENTSNGRKWLFRTRDR